MFSVLRRRVSFVHVGLVVVLVFVMSGGAYAAGKFLITSTKQIKPSVLAQLKGKVGKTGPAGLVGPRGAVGPAGAQGSAGAAGKGEKGEKGERGEKGEAGVQGTAGVTGFTKTLPSKETETGEWELYLNAPSALSSQANAVSFNIPLAKAPTAHYIREDGKEPYFDETTGKEEQREQSACPGNGASPRALPGNLCIYATFEANLEKEIAPYKLVFPVICSISTPSTYLGTCLASVSAADKYGFGLHAFSEAAGAMQAGGTWAVSAAEE
jgi:hypothetical protein